MVLHKLNDNSDIVGIVLYRDDPHDICCVFCIWVLAVFVG